EGVRERHRDGQRAVVAGAPREDAGELSGGRAFALVARGGGIRQVLGDRLLHAQAGDHPRCGGVESSDHAVRLPSRTATKTESAMTASRMPARARSCIASGAAPVSGSWPGWLTGLWLPSTPGSPISSK